MTGWDWVAWVSSWVALGAWLLSLATLGLAIAADQGVLMLQPLAPALQVSVFIFVQVGVVAHTLLAYRVHKGRHLTGDEASKLAGMLQLGFGYSAWRKAVRARQR